MPRPARPCQALPEIERYPEFGGDSLGVACTCQSFLPIPFLHPESGANLCWSRGQARFCFIISLHRAASWRSSWPGKSNNAILMRPAAVPAWPLLSSPLLHSFVSHCGASAARRPALVLIHCLAGCTSKARRPSRIRPPQPSARLPLPMRLVSRHRRFHLDQLIQINPQRPSGRIHGSKCAS